MALPAKTEVGKKILQIIIQRLKTITVANGYDFDLNEVALNTQTVDLEDLPAACVFSGMIKMIQANGCNLKWARLIGVDLLLKVDPRGDGLESECAFDEIYRALFGPEDGVTFKGVGNGQQMLEGNASIFELTDATITEREDGNRVMGIKLDLYVEYITRLTGV